MTSQGDSSQDQKREKQGLTSRVGPVEIDWPASIGYYGGIALATTFGVIEPPLALFIAAVPFFKMLQRPNASLSVRWVSEILDGASKPVGGDGELVIQAVFAKKPPTPGRGLGSR
ncbi:MAG: hypothetical protein JOZ41_03005, partial [Chloroflexi bacterium]|nr:hypothetical protein [Chloroflexota bacterium]